GPRVSTTNRPASNVTPSGPTNAGGDTARAYSLFQQKQYAAAAREAKQVAASNPNNAEAWKIAGFSEMNLKQYADAASDLKHALDLQRTAGKEDTNTADALAQALVFTEKYEEALPLLTAATTRKGAQPDAAMLYYRGLAEYQTNKKADAERSFSAAVKANPKDARALYYLGQIAFERNDMDATIAALNRATLNDAQIASAWQLLTIAYLRRAGAGTVKARADADYLNAVRAGESLVRARSDAATNTLLGQALIGAGQMTRAATVLEKAAADKDAKGGTFYLLGFTYSRAKNYLKAITALEHAAQLSPDDANVYRELGYAYEISKQYPKALEAYQRGAQLAPDDDYFKQSVERVQPFAK
ncbi:MAG TPA: tetratricopeptide repeat protein, partial [Pyrinomonadaceae bacterium]|nr:tetratricopeptide repeat protein [Pyrinomonadaceae bacterium]